VNELNISVRDNTVSARDLNQLRDNCAQYFHTKKIHRYFAGTEMVLNKMRASYYYGTGKGKTGAKITRAVVHVDLFKWSTVKPISQIPQTYADEMITSNVLETELVMFKPRVVICAIEIKKIISVLPKIPWAVFCKYKKTHTKRQEVVLVMYAMKQMDYVSQTPILFIQVEATPNPFGKLRIYEKKELGEKIRRVMDGEPVQSVVEVPKEDEETEEETKQNDAEEGFEEE